MFYVDCLLRLVVVWGVLLCLGVCLFWWLCLLLVVLCIVV